ncbi:DegT/DnrJ/EryC1/StrS family aminotransferase [Chryseobacterium taklimakanense]|uniref:DegT/DnrJ/EryC1/StrS family aminotransferase n=1 Tax=Chryseobacterium taklimakanense TaxID=536441 RepID=UPI000F5DEF90|nr:DegT/DnrJ/EryC1/StrS family aminotransferase [Chryseobacterium taklimakanense]AZI23400.1 DegT/DnrJ/EryC1/StrS family aminotransferase [Chryseobacterium taklimakanense]
MIPIVKPFIPEPEELMPALQETLYSGYIAEGEKVYEFEKEFSDYIGNPHALSLNSGTAALHIALMLAGVGKGDEVISTVLTAEPTNTTIKLMGAKVVWADVQPDTGLLDPRSVREKITDKTKAIMLVHYAGMVCDMDEFNKISEEFNIPIIEDAAHALGSKYAGKMIGNNSPYTIFSLQAIKHMTTVDGGFLMLRSRENFDKGRLLRWFGLDKKVARLENDIKFPGYKYHMNNVNATVGLVQMKHLEKIVGKYISNGKFYDESLKNISGLELLRYNDNTEPSYWLYTMKVDRRGDFIKKMAENGISASELHLRNDRHSVFAESKTYLPVFDEFYKKMVHIPCGWWVTEEDREKIVSTIKEGW